MAKAKNKNVPRPASETGERLQCLREIMEGYGMRRKDVAELIGVCPPAVVTMLKTDDTSVSHLETVARSMGYLLQIRLWKGDDMHDADCVSEEEIRRFILPKDSSGRLLAPVARAMARYGFTCRDIAVILRMEPRAVRYWFGQDDIFISRLEQVAGAMGCSLDIQCIPVCTDGSRYREAAKIKVEELPEFRAQKQACRENVAERKKMEREQRRQEALKQCKGLPWTKWPRVFDHTYLMTSDSGLYKIGKSIDIPFRLRSLRNSDPSIRLVAAYPGDIERALHKKYKAHRRHGEWFSFTDGEVEKLVRDEGFIDASYE